MSSSTPALTPVSNVQARTLLQTMCNFLLPLIQTADAQATKELDNQILSGIEADKFVTALEDFMLDAVSRSRADHNRDVSIEVTYDDLGGPVSDRQPMKGDEDQGGNDIANEEYVLSKDQITTQLVSESFTDTNRAEKEDWLEKLRSFITQNFPIRVLCFELHDPDLKISLMEKADIYNYLAPKFRAHYNTLSEPSSQRTRSGSHVLGVSDFEDWLAKHARYAILSHTWNQTSAELTYGDWKKGPLDAKKSTFQKVANFCKTAWKDYEITFGWIDSVCINKDSSAELDESIRSMYQWYRNATICITYLADTTRLLDMPKDRWFTRGWTLQELIAPPCLKFYNSHWRQLNDLHWDNDKEDPSILKHIETATGITRKELHDIQKSPISRRMQLAAERKVTREEDAAYCLMGIFSVSISTEYGEGAQRAFFRLVKEIFDSTRCVLDIFNWGGIQPRSAKSITSLFPSSPRNYLSRSLDNNFQYDTWRPIEPLTLTHLGLRTTILILPALSSLEPILDYHPIGDYHATVVISEAGFFADTVKLGSRHYYLMDKRLFKLKDDDLRSNGRKTHPFGILNVEGDEAYIRIPTTCLAVLLELESPQNHNIEAHSQHYRRKYTKEPIIFNLNKNPDISDGNHYHKIKQDQLKRHGMKVATLYL